LADIMLGGLGLMVSICTLFLLFTLHAFDV
jgi:hypothetical protein